MIGCLAGILLIFLFGYIGLLYDWVLVLAFVIGIVVQGVFTYYVYYKECPYCKQRIATRKMRGYYYCSNCQKLVKIKDNYIFQVDEKPNKSVTYAAVLLFFIECTNLEDFNRKKQENIYNFIINEFYLTESEKKGLYNICCSFNYLKDFEMMIYQDFELSSLIDACVYMKKESSRVESNSTIFDRIFPKKENKFDELTYTYSYDIQLKHIIERMIEGFKVEDPKFKNLSPDGNVIELEKFKFNLLKEILKITKWYEGNSSNLQNYFIKKYLSIFKISLNEFESFVMNKCDDVDKSTSKDMQLTLDECYKLLKVDNTAAKSDIDKSYNHLMSVYDVENTELPEELKEEFYETRKKIKEAYKLIIKYN